MSHHHLGRDDSPFGEQVWSMLDSAVVGAARSRLTARRLLDVEGPYGFSLKSIPLDDVPVGKGEVSMLAARTLPVPVLEVGFLLGARDLSAFEETGFPINAKAIVDAANAVADAEDALILQGNKSLGIEGLLTASGSQSVKLSPWAELGAAAEDLIKAVTTLDKAGFHGPYILGLAPELYNLLLRRYQQGNQTELSHVETIVGGRVLKASSIAKGGVLMADGKHFASIVIGQDLTAGFIGPNGPNYEFKVTESIVPRITVPQAVCVLSV